MTGHKDDGGDNGRIWRPGADSGRLLATCLTRRMVQDGTEEGRCCCSGHSGGIDLGSGGGEASESSVQGSSGGVGEKGRQGIGPPGEGDLSPHGESGREHGTAGGGEMGRNRRVSSALTVEV